MVYRGSPYAPCGDRAVIAGAIGKLGRKHHSTAVSDTFANAGMSIFRKCGDVERMGNTSVDRMWSTIDIRNTWRQGALGKTLYRAVTTLRRDQ